MQQQQQNLQQQEYLLGELSKPDFRAEDFVTQHGGDVRKLHSLRGQIQTMSEECNHYMKKNVFHNYTQFIDTASEISYLESEVFQLGALLGEQRSLIKALQEMPFSSLEKNPALRGIKGKGPRGLGEDRRRSMQQLLEKVEGAGRLSENQSRYVVLETDLKELDQESMLPQRQIHAFLLNDCLLITAPIPNKIGSMRYRFEALYQVENLAAINVNDSGRIKDVFKLLNFPHQRVFQADSQKMKRRWLDGIEDVKRALLEEGSLVRQATLRSRMSIRRASMANPFSGADYKNKEAIQRDSTEMESEAEWLRELPDELDVCIAQRDFEGAADLIFEGKENMKECQDGQLVTEIKAKLLERERQLCDVLCRELTTVHGGPKAARRAIRLLIQMGMASQACELYLKQCSQALKQSMRELKILDVPISYVHELSSLVFGTITDVVTESQKLFIDHSSCCAVLVVWASNELKHYVTHLVRHIFEAGPSTTVIGKCVEMVRQRAKKLPNLGLDLTFELERLLEPHVTRLIKVTSDNITEAMRLRLAEDSWRSFNALSEVNLMKFLGELNDGNLQIKIDRAKYVHEGCKIWLTTVTISFARTVVVLMNDMKLLVGDVRSRNPEQGKLADEAILAIWRLTLAHFAKSERKFAMDKQLYALNVEFIRDKLAPRVPKHITAILTGEFPWFFGSNPEPAPRRVGAGGTLDSMEELGDV